MEMDLLRPGQSAYITKVNGDGALRHHLLDMGLTPGTEVTLQKIAPMGDPVQIEVRGYELTLRLDEAKKIEMTEPHEKQQVPKEKEKRYTSIPHPGVGELGKAKSYRDNKNGTAIPKGAKLTFALARLRYLIS